MSNTSKYPITIDGVRLDTWAYNVSTRKGRDLAASVAGSDIDTGARQGSLWVPNKKYGPGRMVLSMWVQGCDVNANPPADKDEYRQYRKNLDALRLLFGRRHRLLDVRQQIGPSNSRDVRQAFAEVTAVIDPDFSGVSPLATFTVELTIPGAFWQDLDEVTYDSGAGIAPGSVHNLTQFIGATAPMEELWVVVDGGGTDITVTEVSTGHYAHVGNDLSVGTQWVLDTRTWSSRVGSDIAFTPGGTDAYAQTSYAGTHTPRMFGLVPDYVPQVRIDGSGFNASTRLRIKGRRKYL